MPSVLQHIIRSRCFRTGCACVGGCLSASSWLLDTWLCISFSLFCHFRPFCMASSVCLTQMSSGHLLGQHTKGRSTDLFFPFCCFSPLSSLLSLFLKMYVATLCRHSYCAWLPFGQFVLCSVVPPFNKGHKAAVPIVIYKSELCLAVEGCYV